MSQPVKLHISESVLLDLESGGERVKEKEDWGFWGKAVEKKGMRRDKRLKKLEHCRVEVAKTDVTFQFNALENL